MHRKNKLGMLAGAILASSSLFVASSVFASDLFCVQRAINWNNGGNATAVNYVGFTTVALHSNGVAAYATGILTNIECSAKPWGIGIAKCLQSTNPSDALLSDRVGKNEGFDQPFNVLKPLSLYVKQIPTDSLGNIDMRQPNATYNFHPACVGDLLTGNDQWGNHWTMSFQLLSRSLVK